MDPLEAARARPLAAAATRHPDPLGNPSADRVSAVTARHGSAIRRAGSPSTSRVWRRTSRSESWHRDRRRPCEARRSPSGRSRHARSPVRSSRMASQQAVAPTYRRVHLKPILIGALVIVDDRRRRDAVRLGHRQLAANTSGTRSRASPIGYLLARDRPHHAADDATGIRLVLDPALRLSRLRSPLDPDPRLLRRGRRAQLASCPRTSARWRCC